MKTKICTDIEQSKKLIELGIDVYTADMYWANDTLPLMSFPLNDIDADWDYAMENGMVPAWSLAALRLLLPSAIEFNSETYLFDSYNTSDGVWAYQYAALNESTLFYYKSIREVDACYEMIILLHDNNLL